MNHWLRKIRNSNKMTQQQVALLSNITRAFYTNIENGLRTPSPKTAKKIAKALDFDWRLFYPDEETSTVKEAI